MLDVDGILFPFMRAFSHRLGDAFEENDIEVFGQYPRNLTAKERAAAMNWAHQGNTIKHFGLHTGARQGVSRLIDAELDIHVCTRRAAKHSDSTLEALLSLGIPQLVGFLAHHNASKTDYCAKHGISICVDDKPDTLQEASDTGLQALSLRWRYNQHLHGVGSIQLFDNWSSLADVILRAAHRDNHRSKMIE